jgi:hypothetical protein
MYYDAPICWRERYAWSDEQSGHLFSYLSPEQRVPVVHPLRTIRAMTDDVLRRLSPRFDAIYAATGRPSIPPERLLRTLLGSFHPSSRPFEPPIDARSVPTDRPEAEGRDFGRSSKCGF